MRVLDSTEAGLIQPSKGIRQLKRENVQGDGGKV